jgi:sec-independent protein translocase protein TatA
MIISDILQPTHLLLLLAVALLVLGPKRLPEAARSIGRGLRDFRSAVEGEQQDPAPVEAGSRPSESVHRGA